jgi:hypothetical protein
VDTQTKGVVEVKVKLLVGFTCTDKYVNPPRLFFSKAIELPVCFIGLDTNSPEYQVFFVGEGR